MSVDRADAGAHDVKQNCTQTRYHLRAPLHVVCLLSSTAPAANNHSVAAQCADSAAAPTSPVHDVLLKSETALRSAQLMLA